MFASALIFVSSALLALAVPATTPPAASPAAESSIISITDAGVVGAPAEWFAHFALLPGDTVENAAVLRNNRAEPVVVNVELNVTPTSRVFSDHAAFTWSGGSSTVSEAALNHPAIVEDVVLQPGDTLPFALGLHWDGAADDLSAAMTGLRFQLEITATANTEDSGGALIGVTPSYDVGAAAGQTSADAATSDHLATTGLPESTGWMALWAAIAAAVGWVLWIVARRRRRDDDER